MRELGWRWFLPRWAASQKPTTLLTLRLLVVANAILLAVIGALYLAFAARPGGLIAAAVVFGLLVILLTILPYTNPRRREKSRW